MEVECIGNTQIIHMEETEKRHRVIRLMLAKEMNWISSNVFFVWSSYVSLASLEGKVSKGGPPCYYFRFQSCEMIV